MKKKIDNKRKALVHVAKAKVGLSEVEYRDLLGSVGVSTSKNLTYHQFEALMQRFKKLGFVSKNHRRPKRPGILTTKGKMLYKIERILEDCGLTRKYGDAVGFKISKPKKERLEFCTTQELRKVIAALTYHSRRQKAV